MASTIPQQHHSLDHALLEIDALLDDRGRARQLETSVVALEGLLRGHFELEERSHLFNDFVQEHPRFDRQIERLKQDHREMLAEIQTIVVLMKDEGEESSGRLLSLMVRIGLHEEAEIDLLQRAHTDDLATVD